MVTPYKFNAKELDSETGLYYYGARYYTPELSFWLSVDPMSDERPSLSPYNYCQWNPVMRVDPTGMLDEVFITGPEADAATKQLQKSTNLTLTRDSKDGRISATGTPLNSDDQMLLDAINSTDVVVNIDASNYNRIGAFMGTELETKQFDDSFIDNNKPFEVADIQLNKKIAKSSQEVNPDLLLFYFGANVGKAMMHEVTESFQAGLISLRIGRSIGRAERTVDLSTGEQTFSKDYYLYDKAHRRATRQPR